MRREGCPKPFPVQQGTSGRWWGCARELEGRLGVALSNALLSGDPTNHDTSSPPGKQVSLSRHSSNSQSRTQPGSPGKEKPPSLGCLAPHTSSSIPAWLRIMVIYIDGLDALPGSLPHPAPQLWPTTEAIHNPGRHVTSSSPPHFLTATSPMPAMGTGSWQMFVEWHEF